jgi:glycolate oxidase
VYIPENKDEIIEIVKKWIIENKKIVCRWWWTSLVWNCLPWDKNIVLDISKLNKVLEINNDTVTVETWITNDWLNNIMIEKWLFFPVVLWSHAWAEIWWMISTNGAWMRAIKYWKMGNRVEELEVLIVKQDKEIEIKTLKWIECNEFIWSEWKLWIILSTKLNIINKPNERSIDFESFDNIKEALKYVNDIKERKEGNLTALEIINPQVAWYLNLEKKYYILAEYENNEIW